MSDGTRVLAKDLYEFPNFNDTAVCVECSTEIPVPDMGEGSAMDAPHWRRERHDWPFDDTYNALCDDCYGDEIGRIVNGGETA